MSMDSKQAQKLFNCANRDKKKNELNAKHVRKKNLYYIKSFDCVMGKM